MDVERSQGMGVDIVSLEHNFGNSIFKELAKKYYEENMNFDSEKSAHKWPGSIN